MLSPWQSNGLILRSSSFVTITFLQTDMSLYHFILDANCSVSWSVKHLDLTKISACKSRFNLTLYHVFLIPRNSFWPFMITSLILHRCLLVSNTKGWYVTLHAKRGLIQIHAMAIFLVLPWNCWKLLECEWNFPFTLWEKSRPPWSIS